MAEVQYLSVPKMTEQEKANLITAIRRAPNSSELRTAISKALTALYKDSKVAETLNKKTADYFAKQSDLNKCGLDHEPRFGSTNMVSSGGVVLMTGDLTNIGWG